MHHKNYSQFIAQLAVLRKHFLGGLNLKLSLGFKPPLRTANQVCLPLRPKYTSLCMHTRGIAYSALTQIWSSELYAHTVHAHPDFCNREYFVDAGRTCALNSLAVISLSARWNLVTASLSAVLTGLLWFFFPCNSSHCNLHNCSLRASLGQERYCNVASV